MWLVVATTPLKPQVGSPKFSANSADAVPHRRKDTEGLYTKTTGTNGSASWHYSRQTPLCSCHCEHVSFRWHRHWWWCTKLYKKTRHVTDSAQIFTVTFERFSGERILLFSKGFLLSHLNCTFKAGNCMKLYATLRDLRGGTFTSWHCKTPPNNPICRAL